MAKSSAKPHTPKDVQTTTEMEVITPEDLPGYYANFTTIRIGPWDFDFRFSQVVEEGGEYKVREIVHLWLSPAHAKAVSKLLAAQIKKYENTYGGEIPDLGRMRATED
jgi:hypothetical protein